MVDKSPSIPSISISGVELDPSPMVPNPRILMFMDCPGAPPLSFVMFKPAITPCKPCTAFDIGRDSSILLSMDLTAPVELIFFCVPKPTTITSSSNFVSPVSVIINPDILSPGIISLVCIPTYEKTNTEFLEGTVIEKLPSKSVVVPMVVPLTMTVPPMTVSFILSRTFPVTLMP